MPSSIDVDKSVAQLVIDQPDLTRLFERLGIDYCCGGKISLREACARRGLDADSIVKTFKAMAGAGVGGNENHTDWSQTDLTTLCDHIERTHHRHLTQELPRIKMLVDKVAAVHGGRHPSLHQVKEVFTKAGGELLRHTQEEERAVFPLIRRLESNGTDVSVEAVVGPIRTLESEHDSAGDALATLRRLTEDYTPPTDACYSYRAMLAGLEDLERDTHQHIHKENNILFPRAVALVQSRQ